MEFGSATMDDETAVAVLTYLSGAIETDRAKGGRGRRTALQVAHRLDIKLVDAQRALAELGKAGKVISSTGGMWKAKTDADA